MPSLNTLKTLAFYGGIASLGGSLFLYFRIQSTLAKGGYFKKSLSLLYDDQRAMKLLGGPPVSVGYLHLLDSFNNIRECKAQLAIPVQGKKCSGTLITHASRKSVLEEWEINELYVDFNEKDKLIIVDGPMEGSSTSSEQ